MGGVFSGNRPLLILLLTRITDTHQIAFINIHDGHGHPFGSDLLKNVINAALKSGKLFDDKNKAPPNLDDVQSGEDDISSVFLPNCEIIFMGDTNENAKPGKSGKYINKDFKPFKKCTTVHKDLQNKQVLASNFPITCCQTTNTWPKDRMIGDHSMIGDYILYSEGITPILDNKVPDEAMVSFDKYPLSDHFPVVSKLNLPLLPVVRPSTMPPRPSALHPSTSVMLPSTSSTMPPRTSTVPSAIPPRTSTVPSGAMHPGAMAPGAMAQGAMAQGAMASGAMAPGAMAAVESKMKQMKMPARPNYIVLEIKGIYKLNWKSEQINNDLKPGEELIIPGKDDIIDVTNSSGEKKSLVIVQVLGTPIAGYIQPIYLTDVGNGTLKLDVTKRPQTTLRLLADAKDPNKQYEANFTGITIGSEDTLIYPDKNPKDDFILVRKLHNPNVFGIVKNRTEIYKMIQSGGNYRKLKKYKKSKKHYSSRNNVNKKNKISKSRKF